MEPIKFTDNLRILRRRRTLLSCIAGSIFIVGVIVTVLIPAKYRAVATILIEEQEVPRELVRSTVTSYAAQQVEVTAQRVMTVANLADIIDRYDLYPDRVRRLPRSEVATEMEESISLDLLQADVIDPQSGRPVVATIAFTLAFDHETPRLSQQITNELVTLFLNENLRSRAARSAEATEFLSDEADRLDEQVLELEARLADFKELHRESLPELYEFNLNAIERADRELLEVDREIQRLSERRIYVESELAQTSRTSSLYLRSGELVLGPEDQLQVLQTEYARMVSRLDPEHPDARRMRSEIEALQRATGVYENLVDLDRQIHLYEAELEVVGDRYTAEHPTVKRLKNLIADLEQRRETSVTAGEIVSEAKPDNPVFVQLSTQLEAAEADLRALKTQREAIRQKIDRYEQSVIRAPQVEREYSALARELENAAGKYQEVRSKMLEARVSQSLEEERKGQRFSLIEPPELPETPHSPNRLLLFLLTLVLTGAGSIGITLFRDSLDPSIWGAEDLLRIVGIPPVGEIPIIVNKQETAVIQSRRRIMGLSALGVLILGVLLVHFAVEPLDVLMFVVMRRMGWQ